MAAQTNKTSIQNEINKHTTYRLSLYWNCYGNSYAKSAPYWNCNASKGFDKHSLTEAQLRARGDSLHEQILWKYWFRWKRKSVLIFHWNCQWINHGILWRYWNSTASKELDTHPLTEIAVKGWRANCIGVSGGSLIIEESLEIWCNHWKIIGTNHWRKNNHGKNIGKDNHWKSLKLYNHWNYIQIIEIIIDIIIEPIIDTIIETIIEIIIGRRRQRGDERGAEEAQI